MSRFVYIGGFGNGGASAEHVGDALSVLGAADVDMFTFSDAMSNPDVVSRAVRSASVVTHSAGIMALRGTRPLLVDAFAAPLPTSKRHLVIKTVTKTIGMHLPNQGVSFSEVFSYDIDATCELMLHPVANLSKLGVIARYNAVKSAVAAKQEGIDVRLWYGDRDVYFKPSQEQIEYAVSNNVPLAIVPGIHDQLVLDPITQLQPLLTEM